MTVSEDNRDQASRQSAAADRRHSLRRSLGWRVLAALVLISFVCFLGDMRRRHTALTQMERYAAALSERTGDSGLIPLNLDPADILGDTHRPIDMETLTRSQAACIRGGGDPILLAWSVPLVQVLGRNGRAVVTFQGGKVEAAWITESQFAEWRSAQQARLADCSS